MESLLEDEIVSINAIYTENTLQKLSQNPLIFSLSLPGDLQISLRLEFPASYPDAPPSILGTQSVGDNFAKGEGQHVVDVARDILAEVYQPGSPCIYDLLEELSSRLQQLESAVTQGHQRQQDAQGNGQQYSNDDYDPVDLDSDINAQSVEVLDKEPPWVLSDVATEKRSVFVARAASVESPDEAKAFLQHLLQSDKKVAKATHNITAWRIQGANEVTYQDCDDDGETAAGSRVLHLMQLMDVWNVMIVVTRWYGGVQLGPDRFRIINSVARDACVKGGYIKDTSKDQGTSKKKGKK